MKDLRDEIKTPKAKKVNDPLEQILDENNTENITLYGEDNKPIEFEQIAVIPLEISETLSKLYTILIPITPMEGVNEGEGVLFYINEAKHDLEIERDEKIIDKVLKIYQDLIGE